MVSASMTSFQQWSSKSRAMVGLLLKGRIASGEQGKRRRPYSPGFLLHPHVPGEIIIGGMIALVDLDAPRAVIAGIEHRREECELQRPACFRLRAAIAAGHRVVQPAMRRAGIDFDGIG